MISCPDCGKDVEATFKFCPYCGKPLPTEEHEGSQTFVKPSMSSSQVFLSLGSKKRRNTSSEISPKKVKWPSCASSPPSSLLSEGCWSRSPTSQSSPQTTRQSPQALKRSRVTTSLKALPERTVLIDKSGQHWKLSCLQSRDGQGILYEAEPDSTFACKSSLGKQRFSLKLDAKDGRLFNEQNFFQRAAKPLQVNKWKKLHSTPQLAIPTCVGFGIHQNKYRFLVFPILGRSLQSILDDYPKHVMSVRSVFQMACRLLDALEFLHENEYVHGNVTAENIFVNPEDLCQSAAWRPEELIMCLIRSKGLETRRGDCVISSLKAGRPETREEPIFLFKSKGDPGRLRLHLPLFARWQTRGVQRRQQDPT
ncbi:inactive serine/threonine-protein kinase VRK3 isoform X8 [Lagenorhynchus albirostris]|uniref:inactive serine/threonine-protein kinase VRK3 isoform X8 n=1 Tax=Lagenorhynchus albirostris TaxID=27610 RepID=UPI0028EE1C01|nr:inactive serine/threonine-protein kinase VRK3 isoform X8 [Lagenorhynchus albirostris]